jgi:hypothetical protein
LRPKRKVGKLEIKAKKENNPKMTNKIYNIRGERASE